jgi:2-polyprenyl-3-methyl-5-hydroxy-6-metoxy-1,4-benzoquinol methylase
MAVTIINCMKTSNRSLSHPPANIADFLASWLDSGVLPTPEQQIFDDYYRSYKTHFGPYARRWYCRQTNELTDLIATRKMPTVLDVGSGCGTEALWSALLGAQVTALDIMEPLLRVARYRQAWLESERGQELPCEFQQRSVLSLPDKFSFDIVYVEQAFHHLEPREEIVAKLAALVAPGGFLILSEANGWNPFLQAHLFRLRGMHTITQTHDGYFWGNERVTVPGTVIRLFHPFGLLCSQLNYFRLWPNRPWADRLPALDDYAPQWLPPLFTHFNLVLHKPEGVD